MTARRDEVRRELGADDAFRSAQVIHAALRARGSSVGLTTVYRTLQAMADAGQADVLRSSDGESVYRQCQTERHHHHLVCRRCGHTIEVEGRAVERWAARVADQHGFRDVSHEVEVYGRCQACG